MSTTQHSSNKAGNICETCMSQTQANDRAGMCRKGQLITNDLPRHCSAACRKSRAESVSMEHMESSAPPSLQPQPIAMWHSLVWSLKIVVKETTIPLPRRRHDNSNQIVQYSTKVFLLWRTFLLTQIVEWVSECLWQTFITTRVACLFPFDWFS